MSNKERFLAGHIFKISKWSSNYKYIPANGIFAAGNVYRQASPEVEFSVYYEVEFILLARILYSVDLFGEKSVSIFLYDNMIFQEGAITS